VLLVKFQNVVYANRRGVADGGVDVDILPDGELPRGLTAQGAQIHKS